MDSISLRKLAEKRCNYEAIPNLNKIIGIISEEDEKLRREKRGRNVEEQRYYDEHMQLIRDNVAIQNPEWVHDKQDSELLSHLRTLLDIVKDRGDKAHIPELITEKQLMQYLRETSRSTNFNGDIYTFVWNSNYSRKKAATGVPIAKSD